jgi:hypothetical protein
MLKKIFIFITLAFTLNALACWKVDGSLAVDGETWKFNQKIKHNMEYIFPLGPYIFKMTMKAGKTQTLVYVVQEKKGTKLTLITEGEEEQIKVGESKDIFAKGVKDQPNSIITVKLTNI